MGKQPIAADFYLYLPKPHCVVVQSPIEEDQVIFSGEEKKVKNNQWILYASWVLCILPPIVLIALIAFLTSLLSH